MATNLNQPPYQQVYYQNSGDNMPTKSTSVPNLEADTQRLGLTPLQIDHGRPVSCTIIPNMNSTQEPPPTYEEAIDPNAPPPSYDSLYGRVRNARDSSKGPYEFIKNVIIILISTIGCSITLGVTVIIPVCMIVIGSIYLRDCPQGEYIPVYLLVGGCFGVLEQLLQLSTRVRNQPDDRESQRSRQLQSLLNCFTFGWFIIGSVWVYKIYEPNYDFNKGVYCNRTLYLFAFWLVTSVYIALGIVVFCLCSLGAFFMAFGRVATS